MGIYLNLEGSKSDWLESHGENIDKKDVSSSFDDLKSKGKSLVGLVKNFGFSTAPLLHNKREVSAFTDPSDKRLSKFFAVDNKELKSILSDQEAQAAGIA